MSDYDGTNGATCVELSNRDNFSIFWWEKGASSTDLFTQSRAIFFTENSTVDHRCVDISVQGSRVTVLVAIATVLYQFSSVDVTDTILTATKFEGYYNANANFSNKRGAFEFGGSYYHLTVETVVGRKTYT